jgi:hypothetical protein
MSTSEFDQENVIPVTEANLKDEQKQAIAKAMEDYKQQCLRSFSINRSGEVIQKDALPMPRQVTFEANPGMTKSVSVSSNSSGTLDILYELDRLPAGLPIHFGVEFNFAAMPGGTSDRYFYDDYGQRIGLLDARLELPPMERIGLVDEWLGLDVALESSEAAGIWTMPIQTVSQLESGFELVHQSVSVVPHWEFLAPDDGRWSVRLTLSCDTSAAQAKKLAAPPAKTLALATV